jgi:hypothetical protein
MRSMAAGIDANNYDSGAVRLLAAAIDEIVCAAWWPGGELLECPTDIASSLSSIGLLGKNQPD